MAKMNKIELNEELGEIICDKCNGEGFVDGGVYINIICKKCNGKGKLDWIENIVGPVTPKMHTMSFTHFVSTYIEEVEKMLPYQEELMKIMSQKIAKDIDDQIMRTFTDFPEQIKNEIMGGKNDN